MQVNQILAAALLAVTAVGAMSQEIDRDQLLSARAAQVAPAQTGRTRASVVAETRNLEARGELNAVGEKADAPVTGAVVAPSNNTTTALTRAQVKADLASYEATHKMKVGDRS